MKKKILWIALILLMILLVYIIIIKIQDNKNSIEIEPDYNILPNKKIISVWDIYKKETYQEGELILEEREVIGLVFYETSVNICIQETDICEELFYTETEKEINIEKGNVINFYGNFNKIETAYTNTMLLEKEEEDNRIRYYLSQPAG